MRSTHTYAILAVSPATIADVKARITRVNQHGDYDHMFMDDGVIDMHGIALQADEIDTPDYDNAETLLDALKATGGGDEPNTHFVLGDESEPELRDAQGLILRLAERGIRLHRVAPE